MQLAGPRLIRAQIARLPPPTHPSSWRSGIVASALTERRRNSFRKRRSTRSARCCGSTQRSTPWRRWGYPTDLRRIPLHLPRLRARPTGARIEDVPRPGLHCAHTWIAGRDDVRRAGVVSIVTSSSIGRTAGATPASSKRSEWTTLRSHSLISTIAPRRSPTGSVATSTRRFEPSSPPASPAKP